MSNILEIIKPYADAGTLRDIGKQGCYLTGKEGVDGSILCDLRFLNWLQDLFRRFLGCYSDTHLLSVSHVIKPILEGTDDPILLELTSIFNERILRNHRLSYISVSAGVTCAECAGNRKLVLQKNDELRDAQQLIQLADGRTGAALADCIKSFENDQQASKSKIDDFVVKLQQIRAENGTIEKECDELRTINSSLTLHNARQLDLINEHRRTEKKLEEQIESLKKKLRTQDPNQ